MARALREDIAHAFRCADPEAARDSLAWAANRAAELMTEANRQKLTQFWKELATVHHDTQSLDLAAELRERRGYLQAIVHLLKAVRDQSDDLEATQNVRSHVHGPRILELLKKEGAIRHGDLASRLGITPPSLTQAMHALADSRTITATVHGRSKYYSLTSIGMSVLRRLGPRATLRERVASMKVIVGSLVQRRRSGAGLPESGAAHAAPDQPQRATYADFVDYAVRDVRLSGHVTRLSGEPGPSGSGAHEPGPVSRRVKYIGAELLPPELPFLRVPEEWQRESGEALSREAWGEGGAPDIVTVASSPSGAMNRVRVLWGATIAERSGSERRQKGRAT